MTTRTVSAPRVRRPSIDPLLSRVAAEELLAEDSAKEHATWAALLQRDPEVRAFMAARQ
jgi:spore coat protein CotF